MKDWIIDNRGPLASAAFLLIFLLVCVFAVNQWTKNQNAVEVARVIAERDQLADNNAALEKQVADLISQQAEYQADIAVKEAQITAIQEENSLLEASKQEVSLTTRLLKTEDALLDLFKESYPEVARDRGLGIIELTDGGITLPYIVVPAWFAETFVIEHNHLGIANEQLAKYREEEALYGGIIELKDKVLVLEQEKTTAYRDGYGEALLLYNQVSSKYESCLQEPRIDFPNKYGVIAGVVGGYALCKSVGINIKF